MRRSTNKVMQSRETYYTSGSFAVALIYLPPRLNRQLGWATVLW
jgi:hypothetical protein